MAVLLHFLTEHPKGRVLSAVDPRLNNGIGGAYGSKGAACDHTIPLPPNNFGPTQQPYGFTGESTVCNCPACMKTPVFRKDYLVQTGKDLDELDRLAAEQAAAEAAVQAQAVAPIPELPTPTVIPTATPEAPAE